MKVVDYSKIDATPVSQPGANKASVRIPIGVVDGAPNFTMRVFTIAAGGHTPYHRHDYEHEIVIMKGKGTLKTPEGNFEVSPGTVILVKPDDWHGFFADESEGLEMVCLVPNRVYTGQTRVETPT